MCRSEGGTFLLVIDDAGLRRQEVLAFFEKWAQEHGMKIVGIDSLQLFHVLDIDDCRLCLVNCGASFRTQRHRRLVQVLHGLDAARPIVVMADTEAPADVVEAIHLGARGFIPKSTQPRLALDALNFILAGGVYFPPSALMGPHEQLEPPPRTRVTDKRTEIGQRDRTLPPASRTRESDHDADDPGSAESQAAPGTALVTQRQSEVLAKLQHGLSNKEIARDLGMSEATVKVHVRQIMRKLGASNRTQAALIAASQVVQTAAEEAETATPPGSAERPAEPLRIEPVTPLRSPTRRESLIVVR